MGRDYFHKARIAISHEEKWEKLKNKIAVLVSKVRKICKNNKS